MKEDCLAEAFSAEPRIHGSGEFPSEHLPRIPVDDGDEIHESAFQSDVGDVTSPDLVLPVDFQSPQEIWILHMLPVRDTRVSLRIHSLYSELVHCSSDHLPARTDIVVSEKDLPESPLSEVGRERIYLVDQMENVERNRASPW